MNGLKEVYTPDTLLKTRIADDITYEQDHSATPSKNDDAPSEKEE